MKKKKTAMLVLLNLNRPIKRNPGQSCIFGFHAMDSTSMNYSSDSLSVELGFCILSLDGFRIPKPRFLDSTSKISRIKDSTIDDV